jgi:hypothetical protein
VKNLVHYMVPRVGKGSRCEKLDDHGQPCCSDEAENLSQNFKALCKKHLAEAQKEAS